MVYMGMGGKKERRTPRTRSSRNGDVSGLKRWARDCAKAVVFVSVVLSVLVPVRVASRVLVRIYHCFDDGRYGLQLCKDPVQSGKGAACHGEDDPGGGLGLC